MHLKQTTELWQATCNFSKANGASISSKVEANSALLIHWLSYLNSFHRTGTADSLLDGVESSIREAAGVLSLGLVRQTLFSLRGQIDLLLAWLYFKDHAIEWSHVNQTADGFKLKKELLQYLDQHFLKFGSRIATLREIATRKEPDPYRLLSAHVHAQSDPVLPDVAELKDLVRPVTDCDECALVAFEVAEFLNDVLLAVFLPSWASFPMEVRTAANARFQSADQRKAFFS